MRGLITILLISWCTTAWASCVTIDTTDWTQEEKNLRIGVAYQQVYEAGFNVVPTVEKDDICFASEDFKPEEILTEKDLHKAIQTLIDVSTNAAQAERDLRTAITAKLEAKDPLTDAEQDQVKAWLED